MSTKASDTLMLSRYGWTVGGILVVAWWDGSPAILTTALVGVVLTTLILCDILHVLQAIERKLETTHEQ